MVVNYFKQFVLILAIIQETEPFGECDQINDIKGIAVQPMPQVGCMTISSQLAESLYKESSAFIDV